MSVRNHLLAIGLAVAMAAPTAAEPIMTKAGALPTPPTGQGQVVFFRPGSIMGAALGCTIHEGKTQIARLGSGKYFVIAEAPGKYEFATHGEATDKLVLEVESGETYFVKCNIGMGVVSGRANLSPSDEATFAKKARGLNLWKGPQVEAVATTN